MVKIYRNPKRTRLSFRQRNLRKLENLLQYIFIDGLLRRPISLRFPLLALAVLDVYDHFQTSRYIAPLRRLRVLDTHYREKVLCGTGRHAKYFFETFRMTKPQFDFIVNLIKDHAVFKTQWRKRQASVEVQLKVALHRFTHDGSLCSLTAIGRLLGVPVGSVVRFTRRCASALCAHITRYIKWPTEEEKAVIKEKLGRGNFQDIIGVVDGTMIPVFRAPAFGRDSFATRKSNFAMGATGICDHRGVFIFFTTGFTGTRHDSAAYKDTPVYQQKERFFSGDEHLIGDVAYALTPTMITAYKGDELPPERVFFNETLRETRVKIEHAFGWLKGRFRCINSLRLDHTGENDMRRLNQQIMACVVMYNLLKIEDIPHDMSMEDILSDDFLMLPEEEGPRVVRVRARRRAAAENDDNGDDDDGRVVDDRPWHMFETDAEEARYEREQRILGSRKRTRLTRAMLNRN